MADDPVIARVNGVEIKQSDLDYAASEVGARLGNYTPQDRRKVLLQYVIENELMAGAGQTDGLDKTDTFPGRVKYHERRALRDAFFDVKIHDAVNEADAKKIYDEKIGQVKPEKEIHARHILVATEDEAKEIAERLKKGEDFAALAKEKSKDANAEGGDLGLFARGQMLKPFEDAAFALEVGQISEPVQTQFGWHIIKVEEKRDQAASHLRSGQGGDHRPARAGQGARGGHRPARFSQDRGGRSRAQEVDGRSHGQGRRRRSGRSAGRHVRGARRQQLTASG